MEAHALTMLTLTPAPADLASLASTVKPTSLTALKGDGLKQTGFFVFLPTYRYTLTTCIGGECQLIVKFTHVHSSCFNGGTCTDKINGYSCTCRPGFTGSHCQYEVNECDSQPCLNGGICQDALDSFRCSCPRGFFGNRCQVPPHPHISNFCIFMYVDVYILQSLKSAFIIDSSRLVQTLVTLPKWRTLSTKRCCFCL